MDIAIQSQIKSPLVRTLQSIPTNSTNYVHGIPDNTPPFSKQKVEVNPVRGVTKSNLSDTYTFNIPQGGHLSRLYLQYRMFGHIRDSDSLAPQQENDNPFNFSDSIEWVELRTYNSRIERLYPSSIVFQNLSLLSNDQSIRNVMQGLSGYKAIDSSRTLFDPPRLNDPSRTTANKQATNAELSHQDYAIPLPFAFCTYLKDNFQTRMMEDLTLVVKMKPSINQLLLGAKKTSGAEANIELDVHKMKLYIDFINFHENVEEVIRNNNFKPNIPAVLLSNDYEQYTAKFVSKTDRENVDLSTYLYTVDLDSDALVTNIFVHGLFEESGSVPYRRVDSLLSYGVHYRLLSGTEVITEGSKFEYDGIESLHYSTSARQYQTEGVLPPRWSGAGTNIRLGLNNTDEFFDGGLSFQSLTNPRLEIRVTAPKTNKDGFLMTQSNGSTTTRYMNISASDLSFNVVLKRKVMLRIDGNTGKIQKSLES
jgi:hypothetical protein